MRRKLCLIIGRNQHKIELPYVWEDGKIYEEISEFFNQNAIKLSELKNITESIELHDIKLTFESKDEE